ncbi:MAG: hypothetical protein WBN75_20150, partial [Verrucomicrobiia bacterium]
FGFPEYPDDLFFAVLAFSHSSAAFLFAAELSFCHVQFFGVRSDQLNLCWLYSPDEVIQAGYNFLSSVHTDQKRTDTEKEAALGAFILEIRKDLLKRRIARRTSLKPIDFRLFTST